MLPYRTIALLLSSSLFAGCMVGPDYKQPNPPLAHHYISSAGLAATRELEIELEGHGIPLVAKPVRPIVLDAVIGGMLDAADDPDT